MDAKMKRGRPTKLGIDKKTRQIHFRVSEDDFLDIFQAADDAGESIYEFARNAIVAEARSRVYGDQHYGD